MSCRRRWLVGVSACVLAWSGGATATLAAEERGIDPNQGESLVEVQLPNKAAAVRLQLEARRYGVDFNEHYLRQRPRRLRDRDRLRHGRRDRRARRRRLRGRRRRSRARAPGATAIEARQTDVRKEQPRRRRRARRAGRHAAARTRTSSSSCASTTSRTTPAASSRSRRRTRLGGAPPRPARSTPGRRCRCHGTAAPGTPIDSPPTAHEREHRPGHDAGHLHRAPRADPDRRRRHVHAAASEPDPHRVQHGRDQRGRGQHVAGRRAAADGRPLPRDFTTRYMDPTEVYKRFDELAAEFPNIAQLIPLPNKTNGYQRRAQATMEGTTPPGSFAEHRGRAARRPPARWCSRRALGATRAATTSPPSSSIRACPTRR